jgi:hypothetical protein
MSSSSVHISDELTKWNEIKTVRWRQTRGSIMRSSWSLAIGELDYLAPFLGFCGDEVADFRGLDTSCAQAMI